MSSSGHPTTSTPAEVRFAPTGGGFVGLVAASDRQRIVVAEPSSSGAPAASRLIGRPPICGGVTPQSVAAAGP